MLDVVTVGLDFAKNVFQVHGVDAEDRVGVRRKLRGAEVLRFFSTLRPCLVGMEAHHRTNGRARSAASATRSG